MKRALVAVGAVTLLLLTGCSAPAETPVGGAEPASAATEQTTAPLSAQAPAETPAASVDEAAFVEEVRGSLRAENVIPDATDEQLIQAGIKACELRSSGVAAEDITVIDGEERAISGYYLDSLKIYDAAKAFLC